MTAKPSAGPKARTATDVSLPQKASATPCEECGIRAAGGLNSDHRSLCRKCAQEERTLICDGSGLSEDELEYRVEVEVTKSGVLSIKAGSEAEAREKALVKAQSPVTPTTTSQADESVSHISEVEDDD